jgi:hypothetical protein
MGVPMWRVAHLSDIPYVLNLQQLGGGADNSDTQLEQAKFVSRAFAAFVTKGIPGGKTRIGGEVWPAAFEKTTKADLDKEFPSELSLQLFGGPYGNRPVTVGKASQEEGAETVQAVRQEKLFERCEFINGAKMRQEAGV